MLNLCFDEYYSSGLDACVKISLENRSRPIYSNWVARCSLSGPDKINPVGANSNDLEGMAFAYVVELHWDMTEWCERRPDVSLVVPPTAVLKALREHRAVILVSFAHEGRRHFDPNTKGRCIYDALADLVEFYSLAKEQVWFVTGNVQADTELTQWARARGVLEPSFLLRIAEISSFGIGLEARESYRGGQGTDARLIRRPANQANGCMSFEETKLSRVKVNFPGYRLGEPCNDEGFRWNFGCMNRVFRAHRWWTVKYLYENSLIDLGNVSFPQMTGKYLESVGQEPVDRPLLDFIESLPRVIDQVFDTERFSVFNSQNSRAVSMPPVEISRQCPFEIVTETHYLEPTFVTEKTFKALIGSGPLLVVGTRGVLDYLHQIGVQTWSEFFDESYDEISSDEHGQESRRASQALNAVARILSNRKALVDLVEGSRELRDANLNWLINEPKPWDRLIDELKATLVSL